MKAEDIVLVETCSACPEQYDAYHDGKMVAYLRLRHGYFYASCPDVGGKHVYHAEPDGDGIFENHERDKYLGEAKAAIAEYYSNNTIATPE